MSDPAGCSTIQASANAVRQGLRELTANLLRVTRGAGRPDLIFAQTLALAEFFTAYREAAGEDLRAEDILEALRREHVPDVGGEAWPEWDQAVSGMVNGALQVAAAELLAQQPQATAGRRELFVGYRLIERMHTRQLSRLLRRRSSETEN